MTLSFSKRMHTVSQHIRGDIVQEYCTAAAQTNKYVVCCSQDMAQAEGALWTNILFFLRQKSLQCCPVWPQTVGLQEFSHLRFPSSWTDRCATLSLVALALLGWFYWCCFILVVALPAFWAAGLGSKLLLYIYSALLCQMWGPKVFSEAHRVPHALP